MNNEQFRRILFDNPSPSSTSKPVKKPEPARSSRPAVLLAPRSLAGRNPSSKSNYTFTKPASTEHGDEGSERAAKRQKATSVPKGSRFGQGYTDRAALLRSQKSKSKEDDGEDEMSSKIARIKNLEEALKNEELTRKEFEKLKSEIVDGDVRLLGAVSKGLDKSLLARVRRGEQVDVFESKTNDANVHQERPEDENDDEEIDPDSALDAALNETVKPLEKEESSKKGQVAKLSSASIAVEKLSRNEILARMKAERAASSQSQQTHESALGSRFKRIDAPSVSNGTTTGTRARSSNDPLRRYEIDELGREVLLILDAKGNVLKRKVRKTKTEPESAPPEIEEAESKKSKKRKVKDESTVLGGDVSIPAPTPTQLALPAEEEDDDIFADAGTTYDPFGEDGALPSDEEPKAHPKTDLEAEAVQKRNYFNDTPSVSTDIGPSKEELLSKISALSRTAAASSFAVAATDEDGMGNAQKRETDEQRLARLTRNDARDDEDIDFGGGGYARDEGEGDDIEGEEGTGRKGKKKSGLSEWTGLPTQDARKDEGGKKKKKKDKDKKRIKGD